ncbi:Hypothetical protein CAP_8127 [Chondromyces apiculatus DSM 436]|uniref:Uncharacterized protein n=2 Tax=Chondromyces apiculatus TaxID=51 RepID=A0A017TGC3_9BACT|nr:Hypothetical protein CAP_8127 [Chondromyces apiculatus DSM 436]
MVLVSALVAGRAYFWCAPMQQAMSHCCCTPTPDDSVVVDPGEQQVRYACCDGKALDTLPEVHGGVPVPEVPPAAVVAVLPPGPVLAPVPHRFATAPATRRAATRQDPIRAGPGRPSESCALLQVYRC